MFFFLKKALTIFAPRSLNLLRKVEGHALRCLANPYSVMILDLRFFKSKFKILIPKLIKEGGKSWFVVAKQHMSANKSDS